MDVPRIQDAVHIPSLKDYLQIQTQAGTTALQEKTSKWISNPKTLEQRSQQFRTLQHSLQNSPKFSANLIKSFSELKELESDLEALIAAPSDLETEAFNELLFLKQWSLPLNFVPYLLAFWSILRVYIFPGMAMMMPVVMLILPFIIVKFIFHMPLTVSGYFTLVTAIFSGQIGTLLSPESFGLAQPQPQQQSQSKPNSFDIFQLIKTGLLVGTIVQSFLQPYWSFLHLSSIDTIIQKKAAALVRFKTLYETVKSELSRYGFKMAKNPFAPNITDGRQLVASAHLHPTFLKYALHRLGSVEALVCLALQTDLKPVQWITEGAPVLQLTDAFDYRVDRESRVTFNLDLGGHALLTGPNRGGKSTTLRSLVATQLLAHTYGCAFAQKARLTPFHKLYVCLTPEDLPGKKSRFEREIEFTAHTLQSKQPSERSLVLLDELYHSTNPPDAEKACAIYTEQLWAQPNTLSIISTHLFDFVDRSPKQVQRLCCPATISPDESVRYTYQLSKGICKVSSVKELLVENKLVGV
jgi:MutS domain V